MPRATASAVGDWRFDTDTYDFIAADPTLTTAGLTYADTAAPIDPSKEALEHAPFGSTGVPASYTELPAGFQTPARAAGADFILQFPGVSRQDVAAS